MCDQTVPIIAVSNKSATNDTPGKSFPDHLPLESGAMQIQPHSKLDSRYVWKIF
jgi:hypothetical protein